MSDQRGRRHERYPVSWSVQISAEDWQDVLHLSTDNVSRGGLFVVTERSIDVGTRIAITLVLPDGTSLDVEGEVVHAIAASRAVQEGVAPGVGVRFDERHAVDLALLEAMAASHAAGPNAYRLEQAYISLRAMLSPGGEDVERTSAYQLTSERQAEIGGSPVEETGDPAVIQAIASGVQVVSDADAVEFADVDAPSSGPVFGIDFGTSYTSIALVEQDRIRLLADDEGNTQFPSIVHYPESGDWVVGWVAREKMITYPTATIAGPKRLLGRTFHDSRVEQLLASLPLHTSCGDHGEILTDVHGSKVRVEQVCATILKHAARIGQRATGRPVQRVLLAAPATAGEAHRQALRKAAHSAGLHVEGIIDEPVAAAVAHGLGANDASLIAVYDLGGVSFDFTLLRVKDGALSVVGIAGDAWLGGDDFDACLAAYAAEQFALHHRADLRKRVGEWQRLLLHCEAAKRHLSTAQAAEILVKAIVLSIHGPIDLCLRVDRETFAERCGGLVERSLEVVDRCMAVCGVEPGKVDEVVMIGGASRSPLVRQRVQSYFAREARLAVNPEQAVAMGCAIGGYLKTSLDERPHD